LRQLTGFFADIDVLRIKTILPKEGTSLRGAQSDSFSFFGFKSKETLVFFGSR
jgi:hypothetical protein